MKTRFVMPMMLGVLLVTGGLSRTAQASEMDHKTIFTISAPVEIPGRVLPAGTYVFRTEGDQWNVVQIFNQKDDRLIATLFAIPDQLRSTPEQPMMTLAEAKQGSPEEVVAWFYPGDNTGWEFIYPQAAMQRTPHSLLHWPHLHL